MNDLHVNNVVCTASLGCTVDVRRVAWNLHGEYNPARFAGVMVRLNDPKSTLLVFKSGVVVCTGCESVTQAKLALYRYYLLLRESHACDAAGLYNLRVCNLVASSHFGFEIDVEAVSEKYGIESCYDRELFPGLRLQLFEPKLKVLVFEKGAAVIAGAGTLEDSQRGWDMVQRTLRPYARSGVMSPTTATNVDGVRMLCESVPLKVLKRDVRKYLSTPVVV